MNQNPKNFLLFFGGLLLFAAALAAGTYIYLGRVPTDAPTSGTILPPVDLGAPGPSGLPSPPRPDSAPRQSAPGVVDVRPVTYTDAGFAPARITVRAADSIGCLITVINRSSSVLRVGVSPHRAAGDPGADYGILTPGETGILDVRYPGLNEVSLHNHARPMHEFRVDYGEGCR